MGGLATHALGMKEGKCKLRYGSAEGRSSFVTGICLSRRNSALGASSVERSEGLAIKAKQSIVKRSSQQRMQVVA